MNKVAIKQVMDAGLLPSSHYLIVTIILVVPSGTFSNPVCRWLPEPQDSLSPIINVPIAHIICQQVSQISS